MAKYTSKLTKEQKEKQLFICKTCGLAFRLSDERAGRIAKNGCPTCGTFKFFTQTLKENKTIRYM